MVQKTDGLYSLADKALDVLHHLAQRGSVWPEASATAVRELRDRITQRSSRPPGSEYLLGMSNETTARTNLVRNPNVSTQARYTSSSGVESFQDEQNNEPDHSTSSIGLPQEQAVADAVQPAAGGLIQAPDAPRSAESLPTTGNSSFVPNHNINTPIFDFGNSEWSDLLQVNEALSANAPLPEGDGMDPYIGFDIPFWLGQEQYWDMLHDRN